MARSITPPSRSQAARMTPDEMREAVARLRRQMEEEKQVNPKAAVYKYEFPPEVTIDVFAEMLSEQKDRKIMLLERAIRTLEELMKEEEKLQGLLR